MGKTTQHKQTTRDLTLSILTDEKKRHDLLQGIQKGSDFIQTISSEDISTISITVKYYTDTHGIDRSVQIDADTSEQAADMLRAIRSCMLKEVESLSAKYHEMMEKENQLSEQLIKEISKEIKADSGNA